MTEPGAFLPLDPFDLPEWLGTESVTWRAEQSVRDGHLVRGRLGRNGAGNGAPGPRFGGNGAANPVPDHRFGRNGAPDAPDAAPDDEPQLALDLLAVDEAHPVIVADDETRRAAHRAWRHGQVHVVQRGDRAALACPGSAFTADRVLDAVERMARSVGADPERWEVRLLLGGRH
ncbi:hypothetical protein [uncultured Nocardioides sp.]|uniref:hypothetical protein n=1 Tax=uncultured Nocardioides sp. TaxID=198441 RepID=UPI002623FF3C|nr:hypothetical protein [uncultured Nocardioides sp.]